MYLWDVQETLIGRQLDALSVHRGGRARRSAAHRNRQLDHAHSPHASIQAIRLPFYFEVFNDVPSLALRRRSFHQA
jgi:hypothetical protein